MSTLLLEVVTPERKVFEKQVRMVEFKGVEGEMGIYPKHIPLVTPLQIAPVRAKTPDGEEEVIAVHGGFAEVRPDKVVILAEIAELAEEIDLERAEQARKRAEERLQASARSEDMDHLRAEIALQKAINRIAAARKGR